MYLIYDLGQNFANFGLESVNEDSRATLPTRSPLRMIKDTSSKTESVDEDSCATLTTLTRPNYR